MLRNGRLTASSFGPVLNCKRVTPVLIKRVLGKYYLSKVKAIKWGIINEDEAKKAFHQKHNSLLKNLAFGSNYHE